MRSGWLGVGLGVGLGMGLGLESGLGLGLGLGLSSGLGFGGSVRAMARARVLCTWLMAPAPMAVMHMRRPSRAKLEMAPASTWG